MGSLVPGAAQAPDARWLSAQEAAQQAADPALPEQLLDVAAVIVDLRGGADLTSLAGLRRAGCPLLALASAEGGHDAPAPFDLVLVDGAPDTSLLGPDAEAAAAQLATAAAAAPVAARVLAQVLRASATLPVGEALAVESFAYSMLLAGVEFRGWLAARSRPRRQSAPTDPEPPDPVLVRRVGDRLTVTLNRPHVHNAYDATTRDGLVEALSLAVLDPRLRVQLDGHGRSFCSGGDLTEFGTSDDVAHAHLLRTSRSPGALLHELGDRVEVRVHGACIGAGVELPAFAGRVVARPDATFRLPEVGMGLIPGAGGTVSLPRRIGSARTLLLALSGLPLGVPDALRWGLVDEIAEADEDRVAPA